jgi:Ca-activated chloride channel family protein
MSNEMSDDKLNALKNLRTPAPSEAARQRALEASLLAFDAEQKKSASAAQGTGWDARLRSIVTTFARTWTMDTRMTFGLGTAAVALLLLPLGYQLYTSTAITPLPRTIDTTVTVAEPATVEPAKPVAQPQTAAADREADDAAAAAPEEAPIVTEELAAQKQVGGDNLRREQESQALGGAVPQMAEGRTAAAPMSAAEAPAGVASPMVDGAMSMNAPSPEPMIATPTEPTGDEFTKFAESPVKVVAEEPVSTFSIDVDTASYSYVRRSLTDGYVPEPAAVRIEELINYFDYNYPPAASKTEPFKPTMQIYPTPWNPKTQLLQIGIKGYVPPAGEDKASNLTFLFDTSGSMDEPDKLPLLKRAFALLVDQLSANDTVSIVVYAGSAGVVLEPTKASDKAKILEALENLSAGGSTAGAEGIELAYRLAAQNKIADGINRVILATDGDFNVGIDDPEDLESFIKSKRDEGIFLSVLGFGQGNLGDDTMQALAQNGNGIAAYIDSFKEAQKVLVEQIGGTLETIAKDVKIQVEFNPAAVSEYRLVGYETRALNREDFNNDKVDAGDIGAGHTVTALYEITPAGSGGELVDPLRYGTSTEPDVATHSTGEIGYLKMRFKLPDDATSQLIEAPISQDLVVPGLAQASEDARWAAAVAAFGQKLKGSNYGDMSWDGIKALAQGARGADENGYRAEFVQMIGTAASLAPDAPAANE